MNYVEKLKDPRWQKKRLEILERDNWTCQCCLSTESTLHVHHKIYEKCDPWEYDDKYLTTLCDECHFAEPVILTEALSRLTSEIKGKFIGVEVEQIAQYFESIDRNEFFKIYHRHFIKICEGND